MKKTINNILYYVDTKPYVLISLIVICLTVLAIIWNPDKKDFADLYKENVYGTFAVYVNNNMHGTGFIMEDKTTMITANHVLGDEFYNNTKVK